MSNCLLFILIKNYTFLLALRGRGPRPTKLVLNIICGKLSITHEFPAWLRTSSNPAVDV
jgi:hypothetical protein